MKKILINVIIFLILYFISNKLDVLKKEKNNKKKYIFIIVSLLFTCLIVYLFTNQYNNMYILSILSNISIITLLKKIIYNYKINDNISFKNIIYFIFIGISISFFLELTIFNFRYYQTLNYQEYHLTEIIPDQNINVKDDIYTVDKSGEYEFEIKNINKKINNIYIGFLINGNKYTPIQLKMYVTDAGNSSYLELPSINIIENVEDSLYQNLYLNGKSEKIKLVISMNENTEYYFDDIVINVKIPLKINLTRVTLLTIIILLFLIFRPSSRIYKIKLLEYNNRTSIILMFIAFHIALFIFLFLSNTNYLKYDAKYQHQYQLLAESLIEGKTNINYEGAELLKELDNPYDIGQRFESERENNITHAFDIAYYKEKFYVYYGVLPVITAYIPYYLVKGNHLQNHHLSFVISILVVISIIYFLYQVIKRYFKNISVGHFLLISMLFINSCGLLELIKYHDLYCVPFLYSFLLTMIGLGLWISAFNKEKNQQNKIKLFSGSLLLALNSCCRPQFLLASFFIFPLFYSYFFEQRKLKRRKIEELISILLPYVIVAVPIMIYNYVRFDSVFEFGAKYNLTSYDVTHNVFSINKIFYGIYYYLFDVPNITLQFPFFITEIPTFDYLGYIFYEAMISGFFFRNIICLIVFFIFSLKKKFKNQKILLISGTSLILATINLLFDIEMGGLVNRYLCDFAWLILLPTILILLFIFTNEKLKNKYHKIIISLIFLSTISNIIITIFQPIYAKSLYQINPTLYEMIKQLICFWL